MPITTDRDQYEHARQNAKGWYETVRDLYSRSQAIDDQIANKDEAREAIEQEVVEGPLSAECREGWHYPGETDCKPVEYRLLLTTGGPGLQVWGELNEHGEPETAELQMQDWGVPWREVWPCDVEEMDEARAALLWYASHFYFEVYP